MMKGLSLQQPYAYLILERYREDNPQKPLKPVENRPRPLPRTFELPQRIWIHASLSLYDVTISELKQLMTASQWLRCKDHLHAIYREHYTYRNDKRWLQRLGMFGCLLGTVVITGQMRKNANPTPSFETIRPSMGDTERELNYLDSIDSPCRSPWFFGPYGYTLESPEKLPEPIPYRGALGFFEVTLPKKYE